MPQHTVPPARKAKLPGIDSEATPVLGVGLGLTGLLLGLRPRLAAWPLALTALTALLFRDPERHTPAEQSTLFAPADGQVLGVEELYEHRFLHTDAVRIAIAASPLDVPVLRSPMQGEVAYLEHVPGAYLPVADPRAVEQNVWPLVESGRVRPRVGRVFGLAEAAAAHALMESSAHIGKIVLRID